jgi:hypothetical protein
MTKGKMETWNVYIAGKFFCSVNAYTRKSARLQAKRMPNLRGGEIFVTRAKVADFAGEKGSKTKILANEAVGRKEWAIDWSTPDQLGQWGTTGA